VALKLVVIKDQSILKNGTRIADPQSVKIFEIMALMWVSQKVKYSEEWH
jgi:hypothetical protein